MLKDHGDARDRLSNTLLPDPDLPDIVWQQTVYATKQCGLATARRADNCHDFPFTDIKVDFAKNFERTVVLAEATDTNAWLALGSLRPGRLAASGSGCCLTC